MNHPSESYYYDGFASHRLIATDILQQIVRNASEDRDWSELLHILGAICYPTTKNDADFQASFTGLENQIEEILSENGSGDGMLEVLMEQKKEYMWLALLYNQLWDMGVFSSNSKIIDTAAKAYLTED